MMKIIPRPTVVAVFSRAFSGLEDLEGSTAASTELDVSGVSIGLSKTLNFEYKFINKYDTWISMDINGVFSTSYFTHSSWFMV
jgi:hypothetical protein